jgi:hypothetical protein
MLKHKLLSASAAVAPVFIEDVFSTWLYTGTGAAQTITNGIDLAGKGGLVWTKFRSNVVDHILFDTERGALQKISSNTTAASANDNGTLTSFNSNGFSLGSRSLVNQSGELFASWTFRKAERFFDVVTYTGTGANRTIAHDLGVVPGCIIVKRTDTTGDWQVYHRSNTAAPETDYLVLNSTAATVDDNTRWNDTLPTSTVFSLGTNATVNASGGTYVAYLFAHDPLGPSGDGSDGLIACGSWVETGSDVTVSLGWEPQWLMVKRSDGTSNWFLYDTMRGLTVGDSQLLQPNTPNAESNNSVFKPTATGFIAGTFAGSGATWVYIAIRRGPMRQPTVGTEVLSIKNYAATTTSAQVTHDVTFDVEINANRDFVTSKFLFCDSLRGINGTVLATSATSGENSFPTYWSRRDQRTMHAPSAFDAFWASSSGTNNHISYGLVRAPGFFDVVAYTGTGSNRTVTHNLGAVPELMIVKKRSATDDWAVYYGDNTDYLLLNSAAATVDDITYWNDTSPTSSVFTVGTNTDVNTNTATYIAYLFATLPGISKIGTYTGNGSTQTIDCGFAAGARFVMIKQVNAINGWHVWDTTRGIVAGNDPYLQLNSTAAEVTSTDHIDPANSGFALATSYSGTNTNGGTYLYFAIA